MRQTVEHLVTNSYLLLELHASLVDRYLSYSEKDDKDGMEAIERLYYQLFGKSMSD